MNDTFLRVCRRVWRCIIGRAMTQSLITKLSALGDVDLLSCAYRQMGILNYGNLNASGENHLIRNVLKSRLPAERAILFDVGANRGDYSATLRFHLPFAALFAFEPNPHSFALLKSRLGADEDHCFRLALGDCIDTKRMYTYRKEPDSSHASLYRDVLTKIHDAEDIATYDVHVTTLDQFCDTQQIDRIDFLKIDTEGHELNVLKGGQRLLDEGRIKMIQFEFNSMHVSARVFLKDFYTLLHQYDIWRIDTTKLIPLPNYDARNEIFQFQNLFASLKA